MNNIAAMAVLMPATLGLARQTRRSPARLMMPLAFGVIVGGMATLFTTSNIIASSTLREAGLKPFGVLDFLPAGLPLVILAVLYMLLIGRRLLPKQEIHIENDRTTRNRADLLAAYRIKESLWAVTILPGSAMAGLTLLQGEWRTKVRLNVLAILRGKKYIPAPISSTVLLDGDLVITQGEPDREMLDKLGLQLEPEQPARFESSGQEDSIAEIVLAPHSSLEGKTLREVHLREKTGLTVLALWRSGLSDPHRVCQPAFAGGGCAPGAGYGCQAAAVTSGAGFHHPGRGSGSHRPAPPGHSGDADRTGIPGGCHHRVAAYCPGQSGGCARHGSHRLPAAWTRPMPPLTGNPFF